MLITMGEKKMRARLIAYYLVELFCPKDTIELKISFVWKFTMGIEIMDTELTVTRKLSTHFSKRSLFPHIDADHDELPISTGDGTTSVMALFIKGVDNRATLTMNWSNFLYKANMKKGWSNFLYKANMKKGCTYAFAFKCMSKGLCMIVYPI
ncbi:hypothetical protein ACQJBY_007864 [Aegilops geniculata]